MCLQNTGGQLAEDPAQYRGIELVGQDSRQFTCYIIGQLLGLCCKVVEGGGSEL